MFSESTFDWWSEAFTWGGVAATLIATVVAVFEIKARFFDSRIRSKRLMVSSRYALWDRWRWRGIEFLHNRHFDPEVRDDVQDIRGWVSDWRKARRQGRNELDEILICVSKGRIVLGYVYADYYYGESFMFLSYFVVDGDNQVEKDSVKYKLIESLMLLSRRDYKNLLGIVTELEEFGKIERDDELIMVEKGVRLFRNFRISVNKINVQWGIKYVFGRLLIDYYQPLLGEDEIDLKSTTFGSEKYRLWLVVVIPQDRVEFIDSKVILSRARVEEILSFVFKRLYWDAWPTNKYRDYLLREYEKHVSAVDGDVELFCG